MSEEEIKRQVMYDMEEVNNLDKASLEDYYLQRLYETEMDLLTQRRNYVKMMAAVVKSQGGQITIPKEVFIELKDTDSLTRFENQDGDVVFKVTGKEDGGSTNTEVQTTEV